MVDKRINELAGRRLNTLKARSSCEKREHEPIICRQPDVANHTGRPGRKHHRGQFEESWAVIVQVRDMKPSSP